MSEELRTVKIKRYYAEYGTYGLLLIDEVPICCTLELPYEDNIPSISAIPEGEYFCKLRQSPKFGRTYEVLNVPNRKYILFHKGNSVSDTTGCIILGLHFVHQSKRVMLRNSQYGYDCFMRRLGGKSFRLIIEG